MERGSGCPQHARPQQHTDENLHYHQGRLIGIAQQPPYKPGQTHDEHEDQQK